MIKKWWRKFELIGTDEDMSSDQLRRVKTLNNLLLVELFIIVFFVLIAFYAEVYITLMLLVFLFFIVLLTLYLSFKKKHNLTSFLIIISSSGYLFINIYLVKGDFGLSYLLFATIGIPVVIIDLKKKFLLFSTMAIPILFFILVPIIGTVEIGVYEFSPFIKSLLYYGDLSAAIILIVSQILFFVKEMDYRYKLYEIEHERLIQQGIMSDLWLMTAGIAHEINNPLAIISLHSNALAKKTADIDNKKLSEKFDHNLEVIIKSVDRISKIIKSIKYFTRDSNNDAFELVSINKILSEIEDLFESKFTSLGIKFVVNVSDEDIKINCNSAQLEQALISLLTNAIDALSGINDPVIKIVAHGEGGKLFVTVEDNGIGIDAKIEKQIMKFFYSAKETGEGAGIGLSIAKKIIEDNKGELKLICLKPATFQVILPLAT